MNLIEEIHQWIESNRLLNRTSYVKIGDAINYSGPGIKKAIINNRLSVIQIETIIVKFSLQTKFYERFGKIGMFNFKSPDNMVNESQETYQENKSIEDIIADKVTHNQKEDLAEIKELLYKVLFAIDKDSLNKEFKKRLSKINKQS